MQTFSSDSPLNFVQNLPVIAFESEEEFDLSPYNVSVGVKYVITWIFHKKYQIIRVIHSLSLIYIFQQIPTRLLAPIFRILKKDKAVHLPSWWTTLLDLI